MRRFKPILPPPTVDDLVQPSLGSLVEASEAPSLEALPFAPAASCGDVQATITGTLFDLAHQGDREAAAWLARKFNGTSELAGLYLHQNGAKQSVSALSNTRQQSTAVYSAGVLA